MATPTGGFSARDLNLSASDSTKMNSALDVASGNLYYKSNQSADGGLFKWGVLIAATLAAFAYFKKGRRR